MGSSGEMIEHSRGFAFVMQHLVAASEHQTYV